MYETICLLDYDFFFTICLKNDVLTILSDDCMKNFKLLDLEADRFYSPIELLAEVADLMNTFDTSNIQIKDIKKPEDISVIFDEAAKFLHILDLVVVNKCPSGIIANTYKRLSFMLYEHIVNTGILACLQPKWWRNSDMDYKEFYQGYMDSFLTHFRLH